MSQESCFVASHYKHKAWIKVFKLNIGGNKSRQKCKIKTKLKQMKIELAVSEYLGRKKSKIKEIIYLSNLTFSKYTVTEVKGSTGIILLAPPSGKGQNQLNQDIICFSL